MVRLSHEIWPHTNVWVHTAQSIKHANILKKLISQTPGGRIVAIFGMEDLDPLYFDVSNFSAPTDPPYMSKNDKMCYF